MAEKYLDGRPVIALVLYLFTRNGKEIWLPWPRFAIDLVANIVRLGRKRFGRQG